MKPLSLWRWKISSSGTSYVFSQYLFIYGMLTTTEWAFTHNGFWSGLPNWRRGNFWSSPLDLRVFRFGNARVFLSLLTRSPKLDITHSQAQVKSSCSLNTKLREKATTVTTKRWTGKEISCQLRKVWNKSGNWKLSTPFKGVLRWNTLSIGNRMGPSKIKD